MSKQQADPSTTEPKTVKFEDTLKCLLTDEELQAKGAQLADAIDEVTRLNDEFAGVKQQFKAKIDGATARSSGLASTIRSKAEYRPVMCERVFDFKNSTVVERRLDTLQITSRRDMTNDDRQQHLPLEDRDSTAKCKTVTGNAVNANPRGEIETRRDPVAAEDAILLDNAEEVKPDSEFITSVRAWFIEHGSLTEAQRETLANIINE
jgi:hypothetical protein